MQQLKSGALLQGGKYRIEKVLGQGGFGITYLATQDLLDRKVCIKEFFYKEYCERDEATSHVSLGTQSNHEIVERFLNKFLKEARTISQLEHPNIIKIHDIFKENNTAYYVMDYIEGESLSDMVKRKGALPEKEAVAYVERMADALKYIHQRNINHLDIKPGNIMIRQGDYRVVLIDFGLSKQYDAQGGQTSTTPVGISHGYAPMEQYKQGGVSTFSPETDIYALGATLYKLVTGDTPPQAMDVMNDGLPTLPASLSSSVAGAIKKAMQPRKVDRPNSIDKFLNELKVSSPASPLIQEKREEKPHQIVDEETKVLNNLSTKAEEKKIQKEEEPQPNATFVGKEKQKNNTTKIGCILFLILGCIVLFFVLRGFDEGYRIGNEAVISMSQNKSLTNDELYQKAYSHYEKHEYEEAVKLWKQASENGHANSQYNLGLCYSTGIGGVTNSELAKHWWKKAAEQGHKEAKEALARLNEEEKKKMTHGIINGYEWVDLGLSIKWATCNVGASSPSDYGNYFAWGETSYKSEYANYNSLTYKSNYGDISSQLHNDAACSAWRSSWRLPTIEEWQELINQCDWKWTQQKGHNGYQVTGPNGNCIFLPATGMRSEKSLYFQNSYGYYWSSSPYKIDTQYAYNITFDNNNTRINQEYRFHGNCIRPVTK